MSVKNGLYLSKEDYIVSNISTYIDDNFSSLCICNAHIYNAEAHIPTCNANREIISKYISVRNFSHGDNHRCRKMNFGFCPTFSNW